MNSTGKLFNLYKRNEIWYVRFKKPDGNFATAVTSKETSKVRAERWAFEQIQSGSAGAFLVKEKVLLKDFGKDFFSWDGEWATNKKASGKRISRRHCKERTDLLNNHILPTLGTMKLVDIDRSVIKSLRNRLFQEGYSGNTTNKILSSIKAILDLAEEKGLISSIPKIERAADSPKNKGILTFEEEQELFSSSAKWTDLRAYTANRLACITGLRCGEILALLESDIDFDSGTLSIRKSYDSRLGIMNNTTKNGRGRKIRISSVALDEITALLNSNPHQNFGSRFVFFSELPDKPIVPEALRRGLYSALQSIGISREVQRSRNITFHSWRHFWNSMLINKNVPIPKVQSITGHLTQEMAQRYYHQDDMADVIDIQNRLLSERSSDVLHL